MEIRKSLAEEGEGLFEAHQTSRKSRWGRDVLDGVSAEERICSVDGSWSKELFNSTASQGLVLFSRHASSSFLLCTGALNCSIP